MADLSEISHLTYSQFAEKLASFKVTLFSDPMIPLLQIAKHTAETPMCAFTRNVRGMIIRKTAPSAPVQIIAPGVIIPMETALPLSLSDLFVLPDEDKATAASRAPADCTSRWITQLAEQPAYSLGLKVEDVAYVQPVRDGVMFRIYFHDGSWRGSTNGMIYPIHGWHSKRSFADLFTDVTDGFDMNLILNPSLCYYVNIVHPDHHNVVRTTAPAMYLMQAISVQDSVELTCAELADETTRINTEADHEWFKFDGKKLDLDMPLGAVFDGICGPEFDLVTPGPLIDAVIGFVIVTTKGDRYRQETFKFRVARALRGNVADVRRNFVVLQKMPELVEEAYLDLFPEDILVFADMQRKLLNLIELFFTQYGKRFKCKEYVIHHSRHVKSFNELHEIYNSRRRDGQNNDTARITRDDVVTFLLSKEPAELFYLINPDGQPSGSGKTYGSP